MRPLLLPLCLLAACTHAEVLRVDLTPRPAAEDLTVPMLLEPPADAVLVSSRTTSSGATAVPSGDSCVAFDGSSSELVGRVIVYH